MQGLCCAVQLHGQVQFCRQGSVLSDPTCMPVDSSLAVYADH